MRPKLTNGRTIERTTTAYSFAAITLCLMTVFIACDQRTPAESNGTSSDRVARQPPILAPVEMVPITIENPARRQLYLWRVDADKRELSWELPQQQSISNRIQSGIYVLTDSSESNGGPAIIELPVPALKPALIASNRDQDPLLKIMVPPTVRTDAGWCWIPPGPGLIGDSLGIGQPDERPARVVEVAEFWLSETEVTNGQYAEFLNAQPSVDSGWVDLESRKCRIKKSSQGYLTDAPSYPVVTVTFSGAEAYCAWLTEKLQCQCRLPTELEWEKAARGPESFTYSYGNVYRPEAANQESGELKVVKSFAPNGFGLYDMTGNAFEWVSGRFSTELEVETQLLTHVLRGGSYVLDGMYLRNSFRMRQSPKVMTDDFGFRVARDILITESKQ